MDDIIGIFEDDCVDIWVNAKKVEVKDIFVFIKGTIFNIQEICLQYHIQESIVSGSIKELYEKLGLDFVSVLDGDFAIVIYDPFIKKLHLLKDKLGSVFIYYYQKNNMFMFSTSLKEMMRNERFEKVIDRQALANYLGYMYIYEPFTIFKNTFKLEKGMLLTYKRGEINKQNYFNLVDVYKKTSIRKKVSEEQLIGEFNTLFEQSLQKRGNKNSSVGVFMSSGKDSTLLAKLAKKCFKEVHTYTLGFENERDESKSAERLASYLGTYHHSIILKDEDVLKTILKMPTFYEEPFADPSIIPTLYLTENIHDTNDFYITGEGNDAIFMASSMYHIYNFYPRLKLLIRKFIDICHHKRVYHNFSEMAQVNIIRRFAYADRLVQTKGKVYPLERVKNKRMRAVLGDLDHTVSEKYKVKTSSLTQYYGYHYYTPYYEPTILKHIFATPKNYIYHHQRGKYIFEKVLYQNIPKSYYQTYKKNGFGVPLVDWVTRFMLSEIKKFTQKETIEKQGLFELREVEGLIQKFESQPDYDKAVVLWCYYIFQLWYQAYIEGPLC